MQGLNQGLLLYHTAPSLPGQGGAHAGCSGLEEQPGAWKRVRTPRTPLALLLLWILPAEGSTEHTLVLPPQPGLSSPGKEGVVALGCRGFWFSAPGLGVWKAFSLETNSPTSRPFRGPACPSWAHGGHALPPTPHGLLQVGWRDRRLVG